MSKLRHVGRFADRLEQEGSERERAFADQWKYEHRDGPFSKPLPHLLCAVRSNDPSWQNLGWEIKGYPTQQQATDVATVIQWLGSNVGFCFLEQALARCGYKIVRVRE